MGEGGGGGGVDVCFGAVALLQCSLDGGLIIP